MGSLIEINDTLQLTTEQGFPEELNYEKYKRDEIEIESLLTKTFYFSGKSGIRLYQSPLVRNFLVHNIGDRWLYWGLVQVLKVEHDHEKKMTSGEFKIIYLFTPEEMRIAHDIIDRNQKTNFFHSR